MRRILLLAGLLGLLAGCSAGPTKADRTGLPAQKAASGSTTSSTAGATSVPDASGQQRGSIDACTLLTPAEARSALGKPVKSAKAKKLGVPGQEAGSCSYESTDFANGTADGLALVFTYFPHSSMSRAVFDENFGGNGARPAPGLGESAWFSRGMLNVYAHGSSVSVSIVSLTTEASLGTLTPVARLILTRI